MSGQVFTNLVVGAKNQTYFDRIKEMEYPYALPVPGAKAEFKTAGVGFGITHTLDNAGGWSTPYINISWQCVSALYQL